MPYPYPRHRAREVALQLLFQHDHNAGLPREAIEQFVQGRLRDEPLPQQFCLALYDGVVAHLDEIDRRLTEAAENWRLARMATVDRNVLRLGVYELLFGEKKETPTMAAFSEAVELARRYGSAESPVFVNGILDRLYRAAREGAKAPAESAPAAAEGPTTPTGEVGAEGPK